MADLDNILSEHRAPAPASDTPATPDVTQETTQTPAAETPPAPTQQPDTDEPEAVDVNGQKMVPHQALHAEKQKVKRYTEQVADFERKLESQQAEMRRFQQQLLERIPQQQAQQEEVPDIFANPDAFLDSKLRPIIQHLTQQSEQVSRRFAVQEHGHETVNVAYQTLAQGMQSDPAMGAEWQRIMGSGDPWGELVRWHKRTSALKEIGDDPAAYRERVKSELLTELQQNGGQPAQRQQAPAVMPSDLAAARNVGSRIGPAWGGPAPIQDIFARHRATK